MSYELAEVQPTENQPLDIDIPLLSRLVQNAFVQFEALTNIKIIGADMQSLVTTKEIWAARTEDDDLECWIVTFRVDNSEPPVIN